MRTLALVIGVAVLLSACGGGSSGRNDGRATSEARTAPSAAPTAPSTGRVTTDGTTPAAATTTTAPAFAASVTPVTAADLGVSWREGCPVGPDQLRRITLSYWDFEGHGQTGALVVHADVAETVTTVFRRLFEARVPIRRMETIDRYAGSDDASMAADNTSAFNCRRAVTSGPAQWSSHAFGRAIDVNPVENPYVFEGAVLPSEGGPFVDRTIVRPGMATPASPLVEAFLASGWQWGGRWTGSPDYQHFSADGS